MSKVRIILKRRACKSKLYDYITSACLPKHLAVCDRMVALFGAMYGNCPAYYALQGLLQFQRAVIQASAEAEEEAPAPAVSVRAAAVLVLLAVSPVAAHAGDTVRYQRRIITCTGGDADGFGFHRVVTVDSTPGAAVITAKKRHLQRLPEGVLLIRRNCKTLHILTP